MSLALNRRQFLHATTAALGGLLVPNFAWADEPMLPNYKGPNVIIIRFGGGVRRQECISDPLNTYAPYFLKQLVPQGVFFPKMEMSSASEIETSHGQGTLYLLTGKYDTFHDVENQPFASRFEAQVPTLYEYLRSTYKIPVHQTLIVNHEDRRDEEFYTFSNHKNFGFDFRSDVLSLYRYKIFLLRQQINQAQGTDEQLEEKRKNLHKLESLDYRRVGDGHQDPAIDDFWHKWQKHYGASGFVNPRGDRLLTELASWSMEYLQPKLMMVNYNDPDYVHWGLPHHYTEGIKVIDQGIRHLHEKVQSLAAYRDNTIFVIVPDCGRDNNQFMEVPFQHHFNTRSAREIFALVYGKGVPRGKVVDRTVDQISVAATVGALMGMKTPHSEGPVLEEVFS